MTRNDDLIRGRPLWIATEDFPPKLGGLARWSGNAARALASHGARVSVLVKRADPALDEDSGWTVIGVRGPDFPRWRRFHFRRAGRRLVRAAGPPDLIIASTWHVGEAFAGRWRPAPLTIAIHGLEVFRSWPERMRRRMVRTLGAADRLVAASTYTAERVRTLCPGSAVATGLNGVDLSVFSDRGDRTPKEYPLQLLSAGRLVERKRFDLVIAVLAAARERELDAGLWIVGTGPLRDELQHLAAARGVGDRVRFLGGRGDRELAALYRSADLFVSPCASDLETGDVEGFGLTFIEAAACGTPAAALAEGGVTDAVEDGVSGILTTRAQYVARTVELLTDPVRLADLGRRARERTVGRFDLRDVVGSLLPSTLRAYTDDDAEPAEGGEEGIRDR